MILDGLVVAMIAHCSKNPTLAKKNDEGCIFAIKLIGDATYSMRPWIYSSFKGEKLGLPRAKHIGTSYFMGGDQMVVKMAFEVLRGWWTIILKRLDTPL
jgi:hypothetical protein